MGTTVKYNNNVITTLSNETKKLTTSGKWMESDIEIEDTAPTLQTKSATPTESVQTITADSGYDGLSSVEISAISGTYVGSQVPTQAAQTIHPSTSVQTIASGKYLTGDQTIEAVTTTNLTAANIKSGVVVKVGSATDDDSVLSLTGTAETGGATLEDEANATGTTAVITGTESTGGVSIEDIATNTQPSGAIALGSSITAIGAYAFAEKPITSISAPNCTTVGKFAFIDTSVSTIDLPLATTIGESAFQNTDIVDVYLPSVRSVSTRSFSNCASLERLIIGGRGGISANYWIQHCPSLRELRVPNATFTSMNGIGFSGNTSIDIYDIGFSTSLYMSGLPTSAPLSVLIMRKTSAPVTPPAKIDDLNSLAFKEGGTGGTIYIPQVLYDHLGDGTSMDYKSITNWAALDARGTVTWMPIEGSIYEQEATT